MRCYVTFDVRIIPINAEVARKTMCDMYALETGHTLAGSKDAMPRVSININTGAPVQVDRSAAILAEPLEAAYEWVQDPESSSDTPAELSPRQMRAICPD